MSQYVEIALIIVVAIIAWKQFRPKKEVKRPPKNQRDLAYYQNKVEEFMRIKRKTLRSDASICEELGITVKVLVLHGQPYKEELIKLRGMCKAKHIEKLKKRDQRFVEAKKGR